MILSDSYNPCALEPNCHKHWQNFKRVMAEFDSTIKIVVSFFAEKETRKLFCFVFF